MNYSTISIQIENKIATVILNRPEALNALNKEMLDELSSFFDKAISDDEIRVIILTGSGEKSFVAGADIKEFSDFDKKQGWALANEGQQRVFNKIASFPKPIIAAINGFALGGGLELAMACHFRIASESARMGLPEVTLGLIPGYGGTQRLPKLVGQGMAAQMIMTAEMIPAKRAYEVGLVNEVVPITDLLSRANQIASKIAANSGFAISKAIEAMTAAESTTGYEIEIKNFGDLFGTPDFAEGITAFLEKRKPNFR